MMNIDMCELHAMLGGVDPTTKDYECLSGLIRGLYWLAGQKPEIVTSEVRDAEYKEVEKLGDNTIIEKAEAPKAETPKSDTPDAQTVREALTEAARSGVKIKAVMAKYVPEGEVVKYSNIPAASYAAVLEEIAQLMKEAKDA